MADIARDSEKKNLATEITDERIQTSNWNQQSYLPQDRQAGYWRL
jgi:hypothetical protein